MDIQFFQHHLLKRLSFPIEWVWHPDQISLDHIHKGLFLGALFCFTGLHDSITLFGSLWLCSKFEIRKFDFSNVVALFQNCFGYLRSFGLHMNFRMDFYISGKKSLVF